MLNARDLAKRFPVEAAVMVAVGKLRKDEAEDFSNVYAHSMAVALATEVMRHSLNLPEYTTSVAMLHDLDKRLQKRPQDFTKEEEATLMSVLDLLPEDLRHATPPLTRETAARNVTLRSRILNLADMWTLGDQIVGLAERRAGSMARWPQLDWNFHMEWGAVLERDIWGVLEFSGVVSGEQDLLRWVTSQIEQ